MKNIITNNELIEIIMPPLIGDCIMAFPLINYLKPDHDITLVCNDYVLETVKFLQYPVKSKSLSENDLNSKIIIDFLSNTESASYIKFSKPKLSLGFKDGFWKYDLLLKQPTEFKTEQASSIFLYALELLGFKNLQTLDFSCGNKWQYSNQNKLLIAPSAGNIDRCYKIADFNSIGEKLKDINVAFILGPKDKGLRNYITSTFEIIETDNIIQTIEILSSSKLVIASEGGFMHITAAYGVPLIGLFKVASSNNWFPYSNESQIAYGSEINNYTTINDEQLNTSVIVDKANQIYKSNGH